MTEQELASIGPDALLPSEIEAKAERIGKTKVDMGSGKAFLLAIMAGMFIGMGGMFMLLIKSDASYSFVTCQLLGALVFCLGLFLVLMAGAELFTGNVLLICGQLSKRYTFIQVLKNWVIVYLGNLVGSLLLVVILFFANYGGVNGGAVGDAMITVATNKVAQPFEVLFFKGIMCNFLVCLAVWISYSCRTVVDRFVGILLPISAFVACGFEHCVANMFFLPMGLLMKETGFDYTGAADVSLLNVGGALNNLVAVTIGNIIGGLVLVGIVYWVVYHKKESTQEQEEKLY